MTTAIATPTASLASPLACPVAPSPAFSLTEPIPGYIVRERLGAGGFGEVWKADAPGGIAKAIKIVHGFGDDERAAREINSLNRIKEVRHPFLLSLERIEKVDGHLIIVAELATSSLKQEFDRHREAGLAGIPRNELLGYLQDAADALDYIGQVHSLQHLDIKPENLLLVGGRIKVADFGLVKDLQENNQTLIGGMTPVYAAPELFDGRPNYCSDQYSLAIVYQEMLTGTLPFEGRTTAQLAVQHLHSQPKLDRLPLSDREAIGKALAKNGEHRFKSCREMIDALRTATLAGPSRSLGIADVAAHHIPTDTVAVSIEDMRAAMAAVSRSSKGHSLPCELVPPVVDLDPLAVNADEVEYGPTIMIGIGGVGVRAVQIAKSRLEARLGDLRATPALQFLLIDTDAESLRDPDRTDLRLTPADDHGLLLPLKQASDYRSDKRGRFNWLSRRWIYNIPRSLQTQSFRPLGRLALIDNIERAAERIERVIATATDRKSLDATAAATQLPFRGGVPRVLIVSSMSGGAGSGMAIDIAYLVRTALRQQNVSDAALCGILAHIAPRAGQSREMAVSNSYAFLSELNHYSAGVHPYLGNPECGLPAYAPGEGPFEHTYFVHLGEDFDGDKGAEGTEALARYIDLCAVTPASAFFNRCRNKAGQTGTSLICAQHPSGRTGQMSDVPAPFSVRTFGLCQLGYSHDDLPHDSLMGLCRTIVNRWRSGEGASLAGPASSLADPSSMVAAQFSKGSNRDELLAEVEQRLIEGGLRMEPLMARFQETLNEAMGGDANGYLQSVVKEILAGNAARGGFLHRRRAAQIVLESLDKIVRAELAGDYTLACLEATLEPLLLQLASDQGEKLGQWALELAALPKHRLAGAMKAVEALCECLRDFSHRSAGARESVLRQIVNLRAELLGESAGQSIVRKAYKLFKKERLETDPRLPRYFTLRLEELKFNAFCRLTGFVLARVAAVGDKLRNLTADLNRLGEELAAPAGQNGTSPIVQPSSPSLGQSAALPDARRQTLRHVAAAQINEHKSALVAEMDALLEADFNAATLEDLPDVRRRMKVSLCRAAQAVALKLLNTFALAQVQGQLTATEPDPVFALQAAVKHSTPMRLDELGGKRRTLLLASDSLSPEALAQHAMDGVAKAPTVISDKQATVTICQEVEDIPLNRVAASVLNRRLQIIELAARLHTRTDVPWTPL